MQALVLINKTLKWANNGIINLPINQRNITMILNEINKGGHDGDKPPPPPPPGG